MKKNKIITFNEYLENVNKIYELNQYLINDEQKKQCEELKDKYSR